MAEREEKNVGILAIGTYLPDNVRTNDWWPEEIVRGWQGRHVWDPDRERETLGEKPTDGARRVMAAIAEYMGDPFQGAKERRVMPEGMTSTDMEAAAAKEAIELSGIDIRDIDLLLVAALTPDFIGVPSACVLHDRLGLNPTCFTMDADSACNSFQMQLTLSKHLINGGQARYGLLVQSSAVCRVIPAEQPFSIHFGDGATAVIVGPVSSEHGILAQAHRTDGSVHRAIVCTVEGKNWWEDGRIWTTSLDRAAARRMFLKVPDICKEVVDNILSEARCRTDEVEFFAGHQATAWFQRVSQKHSGMDKAQTLDTYTWAGTLSEANLPLVLSEAERKELLVDGDLVAMFQGGTGMTYSGTILRWGR